MTPLSDPRIDYYFDVISPYSYIGFEALQQLEHQWKGVQIRYIPFFLGAVLKESGNCPPHRPVLMMSDLRRAAKFWDVPLDGPPDFLQWIQKYRTTDALRILLVLEERDPQLMIRAAREFWIRLWHHGEKIFEEQDFVEVLKKVGVKYVKEIIEKSREIKYKRKLEENTKRCSQLSAYGAPWINVITSDGKEHSFFGSDRFHLIADLLNQPQPIPNRLLNSKL